jgi:hypothetical protein
MAYIGMEMQPRREDRVAQALVQRPRAAVEEEEGARKDHQLRRQVEVVEAARIARAARARAAPLPSHRDMGRCSRVMIHAALALATPRSPTVIQRPAL